MPTGFLLLDRPNPNGDHFYRSRNRPILAIVDHITAGLQDLDLIGPDQSAERVSEYCRTTDRSASWHVSTDSDSTVWLLPATFTAWHASAYNSGTIGHEISKLNTDWRPSAVSPAWVDRTLREAARADARLALQYGIPIRKATRAELDREYARGWSGKPVGFIGHWELDPDRRDDPGRLRGTRTDTFPWDRYLQLVREYAYPQAPTPAPIIDEDDIMGAFDRALLTGPTAGPNGDGTQVRQTVAVPPVQGSYVIPASGAGYFSLVAAFGDVTVRDIWFVVPGGSWKSVAGYEHKQDERKGWRLPVGCTHVSLWYDAPDEKVQFTALVEWVREAPAQ